MTSVSLYARTMFIEPPWSSRRRIVDRGRPRASGTHGCPVRATTERASACRPDPPDRASPRRLSASRDVAAGRSGRRGTSSPSAQDARPRRRREARASPCSTPRAGRRPASGRRSRSAGRAPPMRAGYYPHGPMNGASRSVMRMIDDDDDAHDREADHERRDPGLLLLQRRKVDLLAGHVVSSLRWASIGPGRRRRRARRSREAWPPGARASAFSMLHPRR